MAFNSPNEIWISADRSTKLSYDTATGTLNTVVNGTTVGSITSSTALSEAELAVLDGASSTPTASKAVVATASGWQAVRRPVVEDATAVTLTAVDSGALIRFDKLDGAIITLPAPAIGLTFQFVATVSVTSNSFKVITNTGTVFILGTVMMFDTDTLTDNPAPQSANGTTHVAVTMNGTTTGGLLGTSFTVTCVTATLWVVEGRIHHSGAVATPFATS